MRGSSEHLSQVSVFDSIADVDKVEVIKVFEYFDEPNFVRIPVVLLSSTLKLEAFSNLNFQCAMVFACADGIFFRALSKGSGLLNCDRHPFWFEVSQIMEPCYGGELQDKA